MRRFGVSLLFLLASGNIKLDLNRIWIPEKGGNRCLWGLNRRLKLNEVESYGGDGECAGGLRWDWIHVSLSCFPTEMDVYFVLNCFVWNIFVGFGFFLMILSSYKSNNTLGRSCWLG